MEEDMSLEKVDSLEVRPMMNNKPLPLGELVGDALSIISLKNLDDPDDPESVVKRNSFRDLHRPNISHLNWVVQSDGKEEEVMEKVKSFHSSRSLRSGDASSRSLQADSSGRLQQLSHTFSPTEAPILEEPQSEETLAPLRRRRSTLPQLTPAQEEPESEFLIRRQTIGELDEVASAAFDSLRPPMALAASAAADEVMLDFKTDRGDVDRPDGGSTVVTSPPHLPAGSIVEADDKTRTRSHVETLQTYSAMEAMERSREEQKRMAEAQRQASDSRREYAAREIQAEGQRTSEEPEASEERARRKSKKRVSLPADLRHTDSGHGSGGGAGRHIPLSESAIRAADAVTVDILERAISNDIRQFATSCSQSLCVLAAMIVSRVLDSACSRVTREDRLPPATTWTEKARREAILFVDDILSSAMIYVSRGGDADSARPALAWTTPPPTTSGVPDTDDYIAADVSASTIERERSSDQLLQQQQQQSDVLWFDEDNNEEDASKEDLVEDRESRDKVSAISMPHGRLSIIDPPPSERLPAPASSADDQETMQEQSSDIWSFSLARLSIIDQHQPVADRKHDDDDEDSQQLEEQSSSKLHMHIAQLSIIEQPQEPPTQAESSEVAGHQDFAQDQESRYKGISLPHGRLSIIHPPSDGHGSTLHESGETSGAEPRHDSDAADSFRDSILQRYGLAGRRMSSVVSTEASVDEDNVPNDSLSRTTAGKKMEQLRQLFGYRQSLLTDQDDDDDDEDDQSEQSQTERHEEGD